MTSVESLSLLVAVAVTVHNIEEAIYLPAWSRTAGRRHAPVTGFEFRFAIAVLTLLFWIAVALLLLEGRASFGAYLTAGYALAMLLNVFVPHTLGTLLMRRYIPGTATALLLNLPATGFLLRAMLADGTIETERFLTTAPFVVLLLACSIPVLFAVGRRIEPK